MKTIIFEGNTYDFETVSSYFDNYICETINFDSDEPQEVFEQYIAVDTEFTALFEYDFTPIYNA